jgi:hypothetical protein
LVSIYFWSLNISATCRDREGVVQSLVLKPPSPHLLGMTKQNPGKISARMVDPGFSIYNLCANAKLNALQTGLRTLDTSIFTIHKISYALCFIHVGITKFKSRLKFKIRNGQDVDIVLNFHPWKFKHTAFEFDGTGVEFYASKK